jgi:hypothetical protein
LTRDPNPGYIALTDPDWYDYLRRQPHLDEVNFWQPHGGHAFRALSPGETFFFKLRAPERKIAGFGFFERWESMPASYAWDCFGDANGAPGLDLGVSASVEPLAKEARAWKRSWRQIQRVCGTNEHEASDTTGELGG